MSTSKEFRHLIKNKNYDDIIEYYTKNMASFNQDCYYIFSITIIENYDKFITKIPLIRELINKMETFKTEQSFNLSLRLMISIKENDTCLILLKQMIDENIIIKKRTLSPIIKLCYETYDNTLNIYILSLIKKYKLKMDEIDYYRQLTLFFKNNDKINFKLLFVITINNIDVFSKNMIDLFNEKFTNSSKGNINSDSICECCQSKIIQKSLFDKERDILLTIIKNNIAKNNKKFLNFTDTIKTIKTADYVLDGANIGYFKQRPDKGNKLSLLNIDKVVSYLIDKGKSLIIFLHTNHINVEHVIIKKWIKMNILYITPKGLNDDWFWLYYSIYYKDVKIITNDNMCDHYYNCLHEKTFKNWRDLNKVSFDIIKNKIVLDVPKSYLNQTQQDFTSYHIPFQDNKKIKWLCVK